MHYLTVVAVLKDEAKNLREWLEFHRAVGVEHFYLYDNGSTDGTKVICEQYDDITYSYNTMDMCQMSCYFNALTAYRDQAKWMAFIDLDEFLFAPKGNLKERLKDYEQFPGIAVNEVFYGSNGHETRPAGGVLLNYTKRRKEVDKHVKSICQPHATLCSAFNPHSFIYTQGTAVNENKQPCGGPFNEPATADVFRINHYWVKSKEEYERKLTRGRADVPSRDPQFRYTTGVGRKLDEVFVQDNEIEDTSIWEFLERNHD
jgi:hypothetical protein